jgi:hypothetical protein
MPRLNCPYCGAFSHFTALHGWTESIERRGAVWVRLLAMRFMHVDHGENATLFLTSPG